MCVTPFKDGIYYITLYSHYLGVMIMVFNEVAKICINLHVQN